MILRNTLRKKLEAGQPTLGTHFLFTDPDIPEMVGDLGLFDYGEVCAEYSVLDMNLLYHQARAAQCGNLPLMLKPDQEAQGFWTQAAMGAGFKAVLFTDIRAADDIDTAYRLIAADNPQRGGLMGVKLRRPALTSYDTAAYLDDLNEFVFAIMIEKDVAVARSMRSSSAPGHAASPWFNGGRRISVFPAGSPVSWQHHRFAHSRNR